jgi:hypothetical protein
MAAVEIRSAAASPATTPRWPLVVAPIAGLVYYLVLLLAFMDAIGRVIADTSDIAAPGLTWGNHWIYHTFAEAVSVTFGTFIAGGLARERTAIAGLLGGLGITLFLAVRLGIIMIAVDSYGSESIDPWYEHIIAAFAGVAAPIIGYQLGASTKKISIGQSNGFAGIPRLHFLWLWIPAFYYSKEITGPFLKYVLAYYLGYNGSALMAVDSSVITGIIYLVLCMLPVVAYAIPLFLGLALLSGPIGYSSTPIRPAARQTLGTIVLIVGFWIAMTVHYGIILSVNWFISVIG